MRSRTALLKDSRGVALLEFALILPLLIVLVAGVYDIGRACAAEIDLYQAVRAGGQIALAFPSDPGGIIESSVSAAAPAGTVVNAPVYACFCADGTAVSCSTGTCATGNIERYMKISASLPFSALIIPLTNLPAAYVQRFQ